jgi:hypothetical protein
MTVLSQWMQDGFSHLLKTASGFTCPTVSLRWMWSINSLYRSNCKIEKLRANSAGSELTEPSAGKMSWTPPPPRKPHTQKQLSFLLANSNDLKHRIFEHLPFTFLEKLSWSMIQTSWNSLSLSLSLSQMVVTALITIHTNFHSFEY